ncbi:SafA/ExsA family spore coat assembly protein [Lentibacillus sp. CBA3610]|uniref:SafA/ExsA family spore coat assembly protein n=1 Tax=Lentibacillus sp. CBA3610 TaxID=2518176 RepID=UPI001595E01C|nr:SafA/ExsA family spore coat assembly protein [Lentibacillus sp. CBA3610]QKY69571.1 SafA/ExsA family spore coat assembly protein [Lentibacillus sp. CBA3610]
MKIHIVQKGDTLWEIAQQYGVDFEQVKQLNPQLSSPDMIMPGMKIKIPATSKQVKQEGMQQKETQKETQKPAAEKPYKDTSPKPMPTIKEDDVKKPKDVKPKMPVQPKMPTIEQEMNHYTINLPQIPSYKHEDDESSEKQKKMYYQPYPVPVKPYQHMPHPPAPMPQKEPYAPPKNDCGCGGPKQTPMQMHQQPTHHHQHMPMHQQPMPMPPMHHQPMMEPMKHQPPPVQQPMFEQPMKTGYHPYDGNMMDSCKGTSNLEMPAKPTLYPSMKDSGLYHPTETPKSMGMQQGFHYNQMPPASHPHFKGNPMPMPPGFQNKYREDGEESTSE